MARRAHRMLSTVPAFAGGMITAALLVAVVLLDRGPGELPAAARVAYGEPAPPPVAAPAGEVGGEASLEVPADDGKLRIIVFGAHPDDCEIKAGGVAAKWSDLGHHVLLVSVTNGDIGHWKIAGGPLAQRRAAEVARCAEILGNTALVLDNHDGELLPTLENRKAITRLIRRWRADVVMCHRPNDYHPDHRNVGVLVQDAAYMVTVPFFCPDTPHLRRNPVFLYLLDRFQKPYPFTADIAVGIDDVVERKLDAMDALESQFFEGGCNGSAKLVPGDPAGRQERQEHVRAAFSRRFAQWADTHRESLARRYGADRATAIKYAEAFEICEYGRRPSEEEIRRLFPFFPQR